MIDKEKEVLRIALDLKKVREGFPIAPPKAGESKNDFISRCISEEMKKGHEQQQAIAMCYAEWEKK